MKNHVLILGLRASTCASDAVRRTKTMGRYSRNLLAAALCCASAVANAQPSEHPSDHNALAGFESSLGTCRREADKLRMKGPSGRDESTAAKWVCSANYVRALGSYEWTDKRILAEVLARAKREKRRIDIQSPNPAPRIEKSTVNSSEALEQMEKASRDGSKALRELEGRLKLSPADAMTDDQRLNKIKTELNTCGNHAKDKVAVQEENERKAASTRRKWAVTSNNIITLHVVRVRLFMTECDLSAARKLSSRDWRYATGPVGIGYIARDLESYPTYFSQAMVSQAMGFSDAALALGFDPEFTRVLSEINQIIRSAKNKKVVPELEVAARAYEQAIRAMSETQPQ